MTVPALDAHLVADLGGFRLDVRLRVGPGEVVALLGPNGAGKTTALRVLAGLHPMSAGHVTIAGVDVDRPDRRLWTPPERRSVGMVFQDHRLFPHLDARDNVAFGLRRRGVDRRSARAEAERWLDRVGLSGLARRRPARLSGGQAQRVAVARALAVAPSLLLLDEPLAALDAGTRLSTRTELHRQVTGHRGGTVLVTHDPVDAVVLADRLVVVEAGRVVQEGPVAEVVARPRTRYVADLVGLNLLRGPAEVLAARLGTPLAGGGEVFVAFPPAAATVRPGASAGAWSATVADVFRHGDHLRVRLTAPPLGTSGDATALAADVSPLDAARWGLTPGQQLTLTVDPVRVTCYPAGTANLAVV